MKLYENEAKAIFNKYDIQTPKGDIATTSQQAQMIATKLGGEVVVKVQLLIVGRGKAGGIQFAKTPKDTEKVAQKLLNTKIKDVQVTRLLIEEKLRIKRELYFAITVDRFNRCFVAIASTTGGINIEETADQYPQQILKLFINPQEGFRSSHARQIAKKMGYTKAPMNRLSKIFEKIYQVAMDYDAEMIEINPLIETLDGNFVAADARIIMDDNALFRHVEFFEKNVREQRELTHQEAEARKKGIEYVKLYGDIGVVGNGAGLVMATLDIIDAYGGKPANFLDIGGGASSQKITAAIETVLSDPAVKVLFINILGGITRCDEVAKAIVEVKEKQSTKSFIVRLMGTNEQEGKRILANSNIFVFNSMEQAAQKAVEAATQEV